RVRRADLVRARIDDYGRGERRAPGRRIVDDDLRPVDIGRDLEVADARVELHELARDLRLPLRRNVRSPVRQILLEGSARPRVIEHLILRLGYVVEDTPVLRYFVRAAELDERGAIVPFLVEGHAAIEVRRGARRVVGVRRARDRAGEGGEEGDEGDARRHGGLIRPGRPCRWIGYAAAGGRSARDA